jgi:hypothetical protein
MYLEWDGTQTGIVSGTAFIMGTVNKFSLKHFWLRNFTRLARDVTEVIPTFTNDHNILVVITGITTETIVCQFIGYCYVHSLPQLYECYEVRTHIDVAPSYICDQYMTTVHVNVHYTAVPVEN